MTEIERRTPREWEEVTGLVVLDPDGWREVDAPSFEDPITRTEFAQRLQQCTVQTLDGFVGWSTIRIWADQVPRCEREHRLETWPYTRRCEGEAVETVTLTDGTVLRVCALCALDAAEGKFEDVTSEEEEWPTT